MSEKQLSIQAIETHVLDAITASPVRSLCIVLSVSLFFVFITREIKMKCYSDTPPTIEKATSKKPTGATPSKDVAPVAHNKALITKYAPIAIKEYKTYGVLASITLAQFLLETGGAQSKLFKASNNGFGIKCFVKSGCKHRHVQFTDDAPNENFIAYDSVEDSFRDHTLFLLKVRYNGMLQYGKDYHAWADGLKEAGYATNPKYASMIVDLIDAYDLTRYDR